MVSDTYKTIKAFAQGFYKEKGSRFISFAFPVSEAEQVKPLIEKIRKEHHDARHHCFAYMLGQERKVWRTNDDGEPSGTAGKPILGQINSKELTNILIVVSRYFGGTLLGVSGLINAYRTAAASAIENSEIIEKKVHEYYGITFPYEKMNLVMKFLKDEAIEQSDQEFNLYCQLKIHFRASHNERILTRLSRIEQLEYKYLYTK